MIDPRQDLAYDSREWTRLLKIANRVSQELAGILHGFRCGGLRLHRGQRGFALRPELDPATAIWTSKDEYANDRNKWLVPWQKEIIRVVKTLNEYEG